MRKRSNNDQISVHAVAGTAVVLLGLDAKRSAARDLLGFTIYKRKGSGAFRPMLGGKTFRGAARNRIGSDVAPIQSFLWSDYVVTPDTKYTYKVVPRYGTPTKMKNGRSVQVTIKTEDPEHHKQAVYFNRGVAGSQAYSRRFGKYQRYYMVEDFRGKYLKEYLKPEDVPDQKAYKWLSRGLEEAMLGFIRQAHGPEYGIRAAVYEFTHEPAIQAFVDALESGSDVKIVHHAKKQRAYRIKTDKNSNISYKVDGADAVLKKKSIEVTQVNDSVAAAADRAVSKIGLKNPEMLDAFQHMMIERTITTISHNKFIILLKNGRPIQVWTGSTNFTGGGIYGQSNVGHIVRDRKVAQKYLDYWNKLATDPKRKSARSDPPDAGMRNWTVMQQPDLSGPPPANAITPVFSPRLTKAMLDWYADRLDQANQSVFFTAAFSVANEIFDKVIKEKRTSTPYQRYLLLEGIGGLLKPKYPKMAACPHNRIAWGEILKTRGAGTEHQQLIESLTGLNDHVNFLHTKYMLIDPLSDDPVVISGSANFSEASTVNNDENMLIIRGNTRVADIFLGEFMRLFNHFHARNVSNRLSDEEAEENRYLSSDDKWTKPYYEEGNQLCTERQLFG